MYKTVVPALVAAMLLVGCGPGSPSDANSGTNTSEPPGLSAADSGRGGRDEVIRLPEGLQLSVDHQLRSGRHEEAGGGKFQHVVALEFLSVPREVAVEMLRRDLTDAGFTVDETRDIDGGESISARSTRGVKVGIYVKDPGELTMRSPDALGWIRFAWKDDHKQ